MFGKSKVIKGDDVPDTIVTQDVDTGKDRTIILADVPDGYGIMREGDLFAPVSVTLDINADGDEHYTTGYFAHVLSGAVEAYRDVEQARAYLWAQPGMRRGQAHAVVLPLPKGGMSVRLL